MTRDREELRRAVRDVREALTDPTALTRRLGLEDGARFQQRQVMIRCPVHAENTPSCSVSLGRDRTIRVHCFGCDFSADAIGLVAVVKGLSTRGPEFIMALSEAARVAGLLQLAESLCAGQRIPSSRPVEKPKPRPELTYPPAAEVRALWNEAIPAADDRLCSSYLVKRQIDPDKAPARAITSTQQLPRWARFRGEAERSRTWHELGSLLVIPTFDACGVWRAVRAINVTGNPDVPKRLPPSGCRSAGLVLASKPAVLTLRGEHKPDRLVVVEGEPDFMTWVTRGDYAVIGLVSGAWTQELADNIPNGCNVVMRVHRDTAGDNYAAEVTKTLAGRCRLWRVA